jgi:acyl-CoA dehydrogenase
MSIVGIARDDLLGRAQAIGEEVAGVFADEVDRDARFPVEAFDAMREAGLLAALVPAELGGAGASLREVAQVTRALGTHCSSTALIFAMHNVQVACLARHGKNAPLRDFLAEVGQAQLLLASATSELGTGGDLRTSSCAVSSSSERFTLEKHVPVISYGAHADAILATARRTPSSAAADQVLVLCRAPGLTLEQTSEWETLGFRGTCSPGFKLTAAGDSAQILPAPFAEIATATMVPVAHVLWSAAWLGVATAAFERARHYLRAEARRRPGVTPLGAESLAELSAMLQQMVELVQGSANHFDAVCDDPRELARLSFTLEMNNLKVSASKQVVDIVSQALAICGLDAYRLDTVHTMSRLLRDAHGAVIMTSNNRMLANNARMLLIAKDY